MPMTRMFAVFNTEVEKARLARLERLRQRTLAKERHAARVAERLSDPANVEKYLEDR